MIDSILLQWVILILSGVAFFFIAPYSKTALTFFSAHSTRGKSPGVILLTSSLVISWIFAKSITNAANLGLEFGLIGGIGYAVYYLSFIVGGIVIYQLREKGGFRSIHHFLTDRFGKSAVVVFSLLIGFRLFNEVWSNTMVIGSYFGAIGSTGYYTSIVVFTILTLAYSLKGGLRSSLLTDAIQMLLFGVLLIILLGQISPDLIKSSEARLITGNWSLDTGGNLLFVAFLQIFSYPFHDPVLTDRGFISSTKTTLKSFIMAAFIGFICITLFSLIGVYAKTKGLDGQATVEVGKLLGITSMLVMNFIMITSAASTLDSTFSSFSKLIVIDIGKRKLQTVKKGRLAMIVLVILGTLPVFASPKILSATTISGTMVMGLAPVFIFWNFRSSIWSFHLPIWFGVIIGIIHVTKSFPDILIFSQGKYADLLWANFWGLIGCLTLYFVPYIISKWKDKRLLKTLGD